MRKLLTLLSLIFVFGFLSLAVSTPASAADICSEGGGTANCDPLQTTCEGPAGSSPICQRDPNTNPISGKDGIILRVASIVAYIVGIACVFIVVIAGIRYVTSQGDANTVKGARNQILYALIGLVIVILARSIIAFVINRL